MVGNSQGVGKFRLRGRPAELSLKPFSGRLKLTLFLPQQPRTPVLLTEAVKDCSLDAITGIGLQLHVPGGVKFCEGLDQAQHAGVNKVLQRNVMRKPGMDLLSDEPYLRKLLHYHLITFT